MKKLNIWLVAPFSPLPGEGWGGVKTHSEYLVRLLLGLGAEITVILPEGVSRPGRTAGGYTIETMPSRAQPHTREWTSAMRATTERLISAGVPDIVFSEGYYARGSEAALKAAGVPLAVFVHNFHLVHFSTTFSEISGARDFAVWLLKTVPELAYKILTAELPFLRTADLVVPVSASNEVLLKKFYRIQGQRLSLLHNWVDTGVFNKSPGLRTKGRRELGIQDRDSCFLCVGSLWRPKGFHIAIEAFKVIAERLPGAVLLLAGEGHEEGRLKTLAGRELIEGGRVKFLGKVPPGELPQIYNTADIFLMPSLYPEGLAYALIEASACGLPSIATALGGNVETLGDCGVLIPPLDPEVLAAAMLELASDEGRRTELGLRVLERTRTAFSEEAAKKGLNGIAEKLTGS